MQPVIGYQGSAARVDCLPALPDQQLPRAVHHGRGLGASKFTSAGSGVVANVATGR